MTDSFNVINAILNAVNLLIAGIMVFIVTYIDVANRRRQIGIQRAIGITPGSITLSYLFRAIFYSGVGVILADLLFAYLVTPLEARYPFHFPFDDVISRFRTSGFGSHGGHSAGRFASGIIHACIRYDANENHGCYLGLSDGTSVV
jgi:ABC-type antimicrobial peptide transport system permease subunit